MSGLYQSDFILHISYELDKHHFHQILRIFVL
nr:MAG TPA: hypothetical protein [Bacteriophage sp.]